MKIRLLNDDGYYGMDDVKFPVEIEGETSKYGILCTADTELARIGCDMSMFEGDSLWHFSPASWEAAE